MKSSRDKNARHEPYSWGRRRRACFATPWIRATTRRERGRRAKTRHGMRKKEEKNKKKARTEGSIVSAAAAAVTLIALSGSIHKTMDQKRAISYMFNQPGRACSRAYRIIRVSACFARAARVGMPVDEVAPSAALRTYSRIHTHPLPVQVRTK